MCNTCNSIYLCKTKPHLLLCQYEPLRKSLFIDKIIWSINKEATAVWKDCYQPNHIASLDSFSVVGNAANDHHLLLKEWLVLNWFRKIF